MTFRNFIFSIHSSFLVSSCPRGERALGEFQNIACFSGELQPPTAEPRTVDFVAQGTDPEPRVRESAGDLLGALAALGGPAAFDACAEPLLADIEERFDRPADESLRHDTMGWLTLESSNLLDANMGIGGM